MRSLFLTALLFTVFTGYTQKSEELVPQDAVSVFTIDNVSLFQKISLDELVKYEFMEEVQQELFDGSTSGKTLKDSGFDFTQKFNVFFGKGRNYEVSGFTFGIENKEKLFEVFDDFQSDESPYPGVEFYSSFSNRIAIKGKTGIFFRVTPNMFLVDQETDSIWYSRGNDYPWYSDFEESYNYDIEEFDTTYEFDEEYEEFDMEEEESSYVEEHVPVADEDPTIKTYYELRDSVDMAMQKRYMLVVCDELFKNGNNLIKKDEKFANQLTHNSDGIFYFDNSRNFERDEQFWYMENMYPRMFRNFETLYDGNVILGDLDINEETVELSLDAMYNEKLGSIYEELTSAKFDKNTLKYIHENNSAYFTYKVNLRQAYEKTYEVLMPLLSEESDKNIAASIFMLDMMNEFLNKDAIFDSYKGNMFGTYSGIRKIKTKKIIFEYDEENFEYIEKEVEAEEDMPVFTIGLTTDRPDLAEKILTHISKMTELCHKEGNYWVYDKAIFNSVPLYMINQNGLFIFTNDENLAKYNAKGYGSNAISKKKMKKAMKGGAVYAYADLSATLENLPKSMFDDRQNEVLDVVRGKTGKVELTSTKTTNDATGYNLVYTFDGQYDNSVVYILDLINSLYVISK